MQTIIKTNELCYKSGRRFLINHINWEVKEGEHWLVFGMNGSGKTTLLSMIAGYKSLTSGTLEVLGKQYDKEHIFAAPPISKMPRWGSGRKDNYFSEPWRK